MKALKASLALMVVISLALATAQPVLAQPATQNVTEKDAKYVAAVEAGRYGSALIGLGAGLGAGLVIIGAGLGFGKIGSSALESMARQPETAGKVQTAMIIIGALLEGATFFALIVCIQVLGKIPSPLP